MRTDIQLNAEAMRLNRRFRQDAGSRVDELTCSASC